MSRDLAFEVSIEYLWSLFLQQERKCRLTGVNLSFNSSGSRSDGNASLDRKDNEVGYIEGNVQWVHKWVNTLKSDLDDPDLFALVKAIYEHNRLDLSSVGGVEKALSVLDKRRHNEAA